MCCCLWVPMCRMLAYRAEDISKRLVPHELYIREELEESVQFDVSLLCEAHITNLILPLPSLSLYNLSSCLQSLCIFFHVPSPSLPFLTTYIPPITFLTPHSLLSWPHLPSHLSSSPSSPLPSHPPYLHLHASTGGRDVYSDMDEVLCEASTGETTATTA